MSAAPTTEQYIERAKQYYADGNAVKALNYFEKACLSCPCNKKARDSRRAYIVECTKAGLAPDALEPSVDRQPCTCLDVEERITGGLRGFASASAARIAARPCTCGAGSQPCSKDLHVAALDGAAAAFEASKDYSRAYRTGLLLVRMAPSKPQGYLRTAKVFSAAHPESTDCDRIMRSIYRYALANVSAQPPDDSKKLAMISKLLGRYSRTDPVARLPNEINLMIFQQLPLKSRLNCLRVSKAWAGFVTSGVARTMWQELDFLPKMTPPRGSLGKLFRYSDSLVDGRRAPTTKRVKIRNWEAFGLNQQRLGMLLSLPRLERLEFLHPKDISSLALPRLALHLPSAPLRTLILDCCHEVMDLTLIGPKFPRLEHLEITRAPVFSVDWPCRFENLKFLRFSMSHPQPFFAGEMGRLLPKLEQLYFDRIIFFSIPSFVEHMGDCLPNLKALFIGKDAILTPQSPDSRAFPTLPESLRVLHLDTQHYEIYKELSRCPEPMTRPRFAQLEHFTFSANSYSVDAVLELLRPSLEAGSLRTLDVGMPLSDPTEPGLSEQDSAARIQRFVADPALLSSVTAVGMSGFRFASASYRASLSAEPFAAWVKNFSNARVVHAYPEPFENAGEVVPALVKAVDGVRVIYQNCLRGELRSRVLPWAAQKGVQIVDTKDPWAPVRFPYVFEADNAGDVGAQ
ncbi:hypothetical protein RB599_004972 [Gaeumannomyces hyphopodioides]